MDNGIPRYPHGPIDNAETLAQCFGPLPIKESNPHWLVYLEYDVIFNCDSIVHDCNFTGSILHIWVWNGPFCELGEIWLMKGNLSCDDL